MNRYCLENRLLAHILEAVSSRLLGLLGNVGIFRSAVSMLAIDASNPLKTYALSPAATF